MLEKNNLAQVAQILPSDINGALEQPPIVDLMRVTGKQQIVRYIEFELVKMTSLVSVGNSLNDAQVQFIANNLVDLFPNETLADFKICFQRGCIGQYGEIYRMDGIVLRKWMTQYLEEKYEALENKLKKESVKADEKIELPENRDWLKVWQDSIDALPGRKVPDLTDEEINREGQQRPLKRQYTPTVDAVKEHKEKMRSARSKYFLEHFPDASEEEVEAYVNKFSDL